ncbi:hypothetical protein [Benzoatithermus flavus]|uniref:Uncharacterized protein n=1 Tax=Benzoatithermus flavus TaxID=3108223 RepID=A0ABU8XRT5_9PROT
MHERFRRGSFDVRMVRLQPWKVWALAAVGAVFVLTVLIAMASLLVILVPVALVGGLVAKLLLGTSTRRPAPAPRGRPDVIEGRYEVIEVHREPRGR